MKIAYSLALLATAVVSASADSVLYSNGPINGTIGGYTINLGLSVSDSFVLSSESTVTGVDFGGVVLPGWAVASVQWSIGTAPGDSSLGGGVANTTDTFFSVLPAMGPTGEALQFDSDSFSTGNISLGAGTYYLTLQNAASTIIDNSESIVGWDVNNGPSSAFSDSPLCALGFGDPCNTFGAGTNSESFDIRGTAGTVAVTPEPGSYAALILGFGGVMLVVRSRRAKQCEQ